ncbi:MAG TPA: hypothetical protein DCG54_04220 [Anaerolineae bacterium]|jgi:hypothetical protein|nr:hypothetical protein [Anaerolineae bacterium]
MKNTLGKIISILMLLALFAAALPAQTALAASPEQDQQPPDQRGARIVERRFKLEQRRYEGQGKVFDKSADLLEKAQDIIDRAAENDLDTSAAQSALENLEEAIEAVKPTYAQAGDLIDNHAGFDAGGKATDIETAAETVEKTHKLLDQVRDDVHDEREALQHALWDLFQAGLKK